MKIVAIIQARMGSTRLPGKVLKDILGKPMLWHLINRLEHARLVDKIIIATSDNKGDRPIISFAEENEIPCYAGSDVDLLDRLYQAAKKFGADAVVRITGDCPLVDPAVVDKVTKAYLDNEDSFDYVSNVHPPTYPDGLDTEIFSFQALKRAWEEVKEPFRREWITTNFFEHPKKYRLGNVEYDEDLSYMRWTVDYEDDFDFVTQIYERLYEEDRVFLMEDVLNLLRQNPKLMDINKGHIANEAYIEALETRKGGR
jgi:spore coat polysaccharide biosynthesis protein SpsF